MLVKRLIALALGMAMLALLLTGCGERATPEPTPTPLPPTATPLPPTPIPTPEPTATPTPLSAQAILQAAFDATQSGSSYRFDMDMEMTMSGPDVGEDIPLTMRFQGDVVPPDNVQGAMTMSVNDVDVETQMVMIGDQIYVLNPLTNQWQISNQSSTAFNPEDLTMNPEDVEDLTLVGETTVEDTAVYHLTGRALLPFTFEAPLGDVEADMRVEYWIGIDDLRMVRAVVEGDFEFSGGIEASAAMSMTMYMYDYGAPIEIVAPEVPDAAMLDLPGVGAIPIEPRLLAPLAEDTPEGHIQRGLDSLADGRTGLALAHFDRALALQPGWPEALLYRGAAQAIDGDMDLAFADLDQAIAAEPERADAYALRAWAHLRGAFREEVELADALELARPDVARALELDPELAAAQSLQATLDAFAALVLYDSDPEQAIDDFEKAMSDLSAVMGNAPDQATGIYLALASTLFGLKAQEPAWLYETADEAEAQLADDAGDFTAYANRGLARMVLGSQVAPSVQTLQGAGSDLLATIALLHARIPELADPAGGPLQAAHIWDLQEGAYTAGTLYSQAFFNENPQLFPEFTRMLTSYAELRDLMGEAIDDPIIFSVAFSPDGRQIATLGESGPSYLRIWDAESGEKQLGVELGLDGRVLATTLGNLAYSPDGKAIVVAYTNPVARVLDAQSGQVLLELVHDQAIDSAAFSPDGATIATVDPAAAAPVLWDAVSGAKLMTMTVESDVDTVAFSPDGALLAGGGEQVHLWDVATGEIIATLPGDAMFYLAAPAFSPDGALLAVPGYPVRVVDVPGVTEVYTIPLDAHTVAFSPDGSRLATAGVQAAGVWDAASGELIFLAGHPSGVDAIAWSPDGSRLVTGGTDGRFRVWDAETGAELSSTFAATIWWDDSAAGEVQVEIIELPASAAPSQPAATPLPTPSSPEAQRGLALFTAQGCSACHGTPGGGGLVGPDLAVVAAAAAQRDPALTAEEYLRQSITDPDAIIAPLCPVGVCPQGIMPHGFGDSLTPEELDDLVAYLLSLEQE